MRRTKIVATLGPATDDPQVLGQLLDLGVDVFRVNLSHGSHADHKRRVKAVRDAGGSDDVAILFDTKGPEVRIGDLPGGEITLAPGDAFTLFPDKVPPGTCGATVNYAELWRDVSPGSALLLDDGNLEVVVDACAEGSIRCIVTVGGPLKSHKKVATPGNTLHLPAISQQDIDDLHLAADLGVDFIAASFIRKPTHLLAIRDVLQEVGSAAHLIAKVETRACVENLNAILHIADGLMVARGDLGLEYPPEELPIIQKDLVRAANRLGKPVITATQMLESMIVHPRPTRAEASDVANAIFDGSDAVMLSAETASGKNPVEAVRIMRAIAERTDQAMLGRARPTSADRENATVTQAVSLATWDISRNLRPKAIITATQSGHTARAIAQQRPTAPIIAATTQPAAARQLRLVWGCIPLLVPPAETTEVMLHNVVMAVQDRGFAGVGDTVVLTAGVQVGVPGTTNLIQVRTLGAAVLRGTGLGAVPVTGKVAVVLRSSDAKEIGEGAVIVTHATDNIMMEGLQRAAAIIAEEAGLTSHAAVVGVSLGIPVLVGVEGALGVLRTGEEVHVDPVRGLVYRSNGLRSDA